LRRGTQCCFEPQSIEDFRAKPIYGSDQTRVDLAYAVYALAHGVSENDTRNALASRDLMHKGNEKRQQEYIDRTMKRLGSGSRTIRKAHDALSKPQQSSGIAAALWKELKATPRNFVLYGGTSSCS